MKCRYLRGEKLELSSLKKKNMSALVGTRLEFLRGADIDRSGRGYFFPRTDIVVSVAGKNIEFDSTGWVHVSDIVEATIMEPPTC